MSASRESIIAALVALVSGAYPWVTGPSRRLKLWADVPLSARPACYVFEGGQESYTWQISPVPERKLDVRLFIYFNSKDPSVIGSSLINNVMDALDTAFRPAGQDVVVGRNTLGGLVSQCRIDGSPMKDPGDLDGDGLLIVPIKVILP